MVDPVFLAMGARLDRKPASVQFIAITAVQLPSCLRVWIGWFVASMIHVEDSPSGMKYAYR
jgi:hypothetical protein